jgi:hypothetical protein
MQVTILRAALYPSSSARSAKVHVKPRTALAIENPKSEFFFVFPAAPKIQNQPAYQCQLACGSSTSILAYSKRAKRPHSAGTTVFVICNLIAPENPVPLYVYVMVYYYRR